MKVRSYWFYHQPPYTCCWLSGIQNPIFCSYAINSKAACLQPYSETSSALQGVAQEVCVVWLTAAVLSEMLREEIQLFPENTGVCAHVDGSGSCLDV